MREIYHRLKNSLHFFRKAETKYQIHSPFVFELVFALMEDKREYYAFDDIAFIRRQLLQSKEQIQMIDFGAGATQKGQKYPIAISHLAKRAASSEFQGKLLFRLVNYLHPKTILELGTSLGIGATYIATAAREARFISLEGNPDSAVIARHNLHSLGCHNASVSVGEFSATLPLALRTLKSLDLVFLDGNHRKDPTLQYFEACLPYLHENSVVVLDDIYWSQEMVEAFQAIQQHPRVTCTLDLYTIGIVFFRKEFVVPRHFKIVNAKLKPWRFM